MKVKLFVFSTITLLSLIVALTATEKLPKNISAKAAYTLWTSDQPPVFLDVREQWEWDSGHIEGAIHIPNGELKERAEAELDKEVHIVVYCRTGSRSERSARLLRKMGFTRVQAMDGGILDWREVERVRD